MIELVSHAMRLAEFYILTMINMQAKKNYWYSPLQENFEFTVKVSDLQGMVDDLEKRGLILKSKRGYKPSPEIKSILSL